MKTLLIVDIQNDFCPGGALSVPQGDAIIDIINELRDRFDQVVLTQDWHPHNHKSFAANHPGRKVGEVVEVGGLQQILWPVHCVGNTPGSAFHRKLVVKHSDPIFRKGTDPEIDSYSAFYDNAHKKTTGLTHFLKQNGTTSLYICGLATDYCVKFSALDALHEGFKTFVVVDACRAVNLNPGDDVQALEHIRKAGATLTSSGEVTLLN